MIDITSVLNGGNCLNPLTAAPFRPSSSSDELFPLPTGSSSRGLQHEINLRGKNPIKGFKSL